MIKKFEYLYVSYEELYIAYLDCRKRKRTTINALEFEINENIELYKLWKDLNTMTYEIGKSIVFCVDKPVKREVFAANFRDRIVHHLLINRIMDLFEKEFIDDSYSCRVGKGTDYGIRKCSEYIQLAKEEYENEKSINESVTEPYIVKCDLKSFFMTINKEKLKQKLFKFVEDNYKCNDDRDLKFVKWLIEIIVLNEPNKNCIMKQSWSHWKDLPKEKSLFFCKEGYGIPIGNLTSQIFANFYLSEFDHFITDELGIKYYGRYVDDFFFICKTKDNANYILNKCEEKLRELGVKLHPKKKYIQHISKGVKFIGGVIKDDGRIYISNRTKGNFYEKIIEFDDYLSDKENNSDSITQGELEHIVGSLNSYFGFLKHYKTYNIKKRFFTDENLTGRILKYCDVDKDLNKLKLNKDYNIRIKKKGRKEMAKKSFVGEVKPLKEFNNQKIVILDFEKRKSTRVGGSDYYYAIQFGIQSIDEYGKVKYEYFNTTNGSKGILDYFDSISGKENVIPVILTVGVKGPSCYFKEFNSSENNFDTKKYDSMMDSLFKKQEKQNSNLENQINESLDEDDLPF